MPDNWRWTFDDDASDLSFPGANFDNRMLIFAENEGEIEVDISFDSTEVDLFYSPEGEPWARRWPAGVAMVKVDVTLANPNIVLKIGLQRVGPGGAFKQAYAPPSMPQSLSSPGIKTFTLVCAGQDASPLDRMRLGFTWTRNNSLPGDGIVRIGFGEPSTDFCEVPIPMADPIIVWNGNTVTLQGQPTGFDDRPRTRGRITVSAGQVVRADIEAIHERARVVLAHFDDAELEAKLYDWWVWAAQGKVFAFAIDGSETASTTLDGAAASGQKVIPLTSTTGISIGKKYKIRRLIGHDQELVHVLGIVADVSVTARDNLHNSYVATDIFRSRRYFPAMVRDPLQIDYPVIENPGLTYTLDVTMLEDRG